MRVFQRDDKFYLGPVSDHLIERLLSRNDLSSFAGVACRASGRQVETYVTLPINRVSKKDVDMICMQEVMP